MQHYQSEIMLKASPASAWDAIKVFDQIHKWHPATEGTVLLAGKNGEPLAVREFQLKGGGFVISELLEYDEAKMRFKYRILKTSLPLKGYVGEMSVAPAAGGGARVHWSAAFRAPEEGAKGDAATLALVQGVFKAGLENLPNVAAR